LPTNSNACWTKADPDEGRVAENDARNHHVDAVERLLTGLALMVLLSGPVTAQTLARRGVARVPIVVAQDATPAELTAARELADHLVEATGAAFELRAEDSASVRAAAIHVGPTARARRSGADPRRLGPEEWVIRSDGETLLLYGGRPRGTLYAVYQFLEDHVGVRWWTPYDRTVPKRQTLRVGRVDKRGAPAFAYRDVTVPDGPTEFRARSRHNGHYSRLGRDHGGSERYGPPGPVHTFFSYVSPAEYLEDHPEFFSEISGLRFGGDGQLCLSNAALLDLVETRMRSHVAEANRVAALTGEPAPRLYDFSANDWGRPCECSRCRAAVDSEGGYAGLLLRFVNRLSDRLAADHPELLIDTLAYGHTFRPPQTIAAGDRVVVRWTALHHRDFLAAVTAPANREVLDSLIGWSADTKHLRVWAYTAIFGDEGELPIPNLPVLASDLRSYLEAGVEGVFLQHAFPIAGDLRDLKLWALSRLLVDPRWEPDRLVRAFTRGYYGAAGKPIRRYLRLLERAAADRPATVRYMAAPRDHAYLDASFLLDAQRIFDVAARRVRGDPILSRRVRHARLTLDRATMIFWPEVRNAIAGGEGGSAPAADLAGVVERYRRTWAEQIDIRLEHPFREHARLEVEREIAFRLAVASR
jgi:hypothetical protein